MTQDVAPPAGAPVLACAGCGWQLADGAPLVLACPHAGADDDVDHVLQRRLPAVPAGDDRWTNPFLRWRSRFLAHHRALGAGWSDDAYVDLVRGLDAAVSDVDGRGFVETPFRRSAALSAELGLADGGGVWVKDETGNVSGSHKARHLFGTMLELAVEDARRLAAGDSRRTAPLAIASCGNAALAAAVVARAARRRVDVFIPDDADPVVVERLHALGAVCTVCPREPELPGDPTYRALLAAVAAGAVPFTCQGNLNGLAVEGGETLGWEIAGAVGTPDGPHRLDRIVVQVGGGALLSAVAAGLGSGRPTGTRIHAVQPAGVHPLARAFERVRARVAAGEPVGDALADAARHRSAFMWAWESAPRSVAHGIIDDETYDWRACVSAMLESGGGPVVVSEATLVEANTLARDTTGIDVDPTGSAGLAGLLDLVRTRAVRPEEHIAVIFTGVTRRHPTIAESGGL